MPENILPLDPISEFVIIMFMMLLLPILFEKMRLPAILGLLLAGLILGPKLLGILSPDQKVINFLADVGKLMVMFFAGLEINFEGFIKSWRKSLTYGSLTFIVPLAAGFLLSILFGFSPISAVLIGSLLASHTLIALPILLRYKIIRNEAVTVTVGATIFTDVAALIVLAVVVSIHTVGLSWSVLTVRFVGLAIYIPFVLFGAKWLARRCFSWMEENEDNKTILMMFIMTLAAIGAEIIHLEGIVGAFVGGLAVNEVLKEGKVKHKLETIGNILFIPMFFIVVGSLIDPMSFTRMSGSDYMFVAGIVLALMIAKYLAAYIAGKVLHYKKNEILTMWSLSVPQVAATLAAALVAYETKNAAGERLISEMVFDSILILMAITTILGPLLTERFAKRLTADSPKQM